MEKSNKTFADALHLLVWFVGIGFLLNKALSFAQMIAENEKEKKSEGGEKK